MDPGVIHAANGLLEGVVRGRDGHHHGDLLVQSVENVCDRFHRGVQLQGLPIDAGAGRLYPGMSSFDDRRGVSGILRRHSGLGGNEMHQNRRFGHHQGSPHRPIRVPLHSQWFELGAALFIGWSGSVLCILGGLIFCLSLSGAISVRGGASYVPTRTEQGKTATSLQKEPLKQFGRNAYVCLFMGC
ncbi:claudin-10a isoform 2-T2 [Menidia menidia]